MKLLRALKLCAMYALFALLWCGIAAIEIASGFLEPRKRDKRYAELAAIKAIAKAEGSPSG